MSPEQQRGSAGGFVQAIAKRALAPLLATAVAFLVRKFTELWQEQVQPKLEESGGVGSVAREAIDSIGEKLPSTGQVTEKLGQVKDKAGSGASQQSETEAAEDSDDREEERRKRKERRAQRQRSLERARSS